MLVIPKRLNSAQSVELSCRPGAWKCAYMAAATTPDNRQERSEPLRYMNAVILLTKEEST